MADATTSLPQAIISSMRILVASSTPLTGTEGIVPISQEAMTPGMSSLSICPGIVTLRWIPSSEMREMSFCLSLPSPASSK
jgi:hypothetical protein